MAAVCITIKVEVRVKWWLMPYLACLNFMCDILGGEPDEEKLERIIKKGILTKVVRC